MDHQEAHTYIYIKLIENIQSNVFLDAGKKPENPEETPAHTVLIII